MKKLSLSILILTIGAFISSQEIVTLSDGRKIIINQNKTWEYFNNSGKVLLFGLFGLENRQSSCCIINYKITPILDDGKENFAPYEFDSFIDIVFQINNVTMEDFTSNNIDFEIKYGTDVLVQDFDGDIISYFFTKTFPKGARLPSRNINAGEEGNMTLRYLFNTKFDISKLMIRFRKPGTTQAISAYRSEWVPLSQIMH